MSLESRIDQAWQFFENGGAPAELSPEYREAILQTLQDLDAGKIRVASKGPEGWKTHAWIKKAVLMSFRIQDNQPFQAGDLSFFDKVPVKKWTGKEGVRAVPPAVVRQGAFVASGVVLMPSYVNIGAYVDSGSMVDTWATVGSCAQIGKNVHLSGGVGIGGVLEPVQASPVIIEDNAFIGSRCIIVEGALIEEGAVIGAGVTITASTKIIDVTGPKEVTYQGRVPARSVVIPGTYQKEFASGSYGVSCALIIGQRKASTDLKISLNQALREFNVSV